MIFHSYVLLPLGRSYECSNRQYLYRSVMIGVSLGASGGDDFLPLFIAIVFHQVFEGLALGSRIGQLVWPAGQWMKKWVMCFAFGVSSFARFTLLDSS